MSRIEKNKAIVEEFEREKELEKKKLKRKRRFKFFSVFFLIIFLMYLILRYFGTSGLIVREYAPSFDNLPKSFYGLKIVQFSDLHYGHTTDIEDVRKLVKKINYLNPDIVVFTGDLIDSKFTNEDLRLLEKELSLIEAKLSKYMVLGNHDRSSQIADLLVKANFIDLNNNYDLIYNNSNESIIISGIGDLILKRHDIDEAMRYFKDENNPRLFSIVITHEGDVLDDVLGNYPVDLALAGHSHNGQVRLPKIGSLITPYGAKIYKEKEYHERGASIYVSGGIGTTILPFRLFNHPSINLIRLR